MTHTRYTTREAELRARFAEYAAALLVERPELCRDELDAVVQAYSAMSAPDCPAWGNSTVLLVQSVEMLLERDDEDTDETARLIFESLAR